MAQILKQTRLAVDQLLRPSTIIADSLQPATTGCGGRPAPACPHRGSAGDGGGSGLQRSRLFNLLPSLLSLLHHLQEGREEGARGGLAGNSINDQACTAAVPTRRHADRVARLHHLQQRGRQ